MNIHFIYLAAGYSRRFGGNKLLSMYDGMPMYRVLLDKLVKIMESDALVADITVVTQYPEIEREVEQINLITAKPVRCIFNLDPSQGISSSIQCGINYILNQNSDIVFGMRAESREHVQSIHQSADINVGQPAPGPSLEPAPKPDLNPTSGADVNKSVQLDRQIKSKAAVQHSKKLEAEGHARSTLPTDFLCFFVADTPNLTEKTVTAFIHAFAESGRRLGCIGREGEMGNPGIFGAEFIPELMGLVGDRGGKRVLRAHKSEVFIFSDTNPKELEDIDYK